MVSSTLSSCTVLVLLLALSVVVPGATAAPSNCLPTDPFNISLPSSFQLQSNIDFSPFSCSLLLLTPPYTILALSSLTGQPLYHWPFPVDYNYSFPSDTFHLSSTHDRLYTLTFSTDPTYDEACTNIVALSTTAGKTAWERSICVRPAKGAEPYAGGDFVVVGNMSWTTSGGGAVDYVVHISSSTSLDRYTGLPVNANYTMAVYESESGRVLSVYDMGALPPLAISLLAIRADKSALVLVDVGSDTNAVSQLLYSLDPSGQLTFLRNTTASESSAWEARYESATLVYTTPENCFQHCTYVGVDAVSGDMLWQSSDVRLGGFDWFNSSALPGYEDDDGAEWWPMPRDSVVQFLSSSLLYITNQANKPQPATNRTLLVAQHAVYNLRTGNLAALSQLLGPVEGDVGDRDPGVDTQLTTDGRPVLVLNNEYHILDAVTLAVVESGVMPSELDGIKYEAWEEWRGVDDTWIWSVSVEIGQQWVAATHVKRGAVSRVSSMFPPALSER